MPSNSCTKQACANASTNRAEQPGGGGNKPGRPGPRDCLNLTAYESFVNLNTVNLRVFLESGGPRHHAPSAMSDDDLDDFKAEMAERVHVARGLCAAARARHGGGPSDGAPAPPAPTITRARCASVFKWSDALEQAVDILQSDSVFNHELHVLEMRSHRHRRCSSASNRIDRNAAPCSPKSQAFGLQMSPGCHDSS